MNTSRQWLCPVLGAGLWLLSSSALLSQESLSDLPAFRDGSRALADSRYGTAVDHLREALETLEAEGAGEVEQDFVISRLLEALVKNGDESEAVRWLTENPALSPSPARLRWTAIAMQKQLRYSEAAEAYAQLRSAPGRDSRALALDHAFCLAMSGDPESATALLAEVPDITTAAESVRAALIAGKAGDHEAALRWIESASDGIDPLQRLNLRSWNLLRLGRVPEAFSLLLEAFAEADDAETQLRVLLLLEAAEAESGTKAPRDSFTSQAGDPASPHSAGAAFFLAATETDPAQRQDRLTAALAQSPSGPFAAEASLRLQLDGMAAESTPPSAEEPVASPFDSYHRFAAASADFRAGAFAKARREFLKLSTQGTLENRHRSLYNAALAALSAEDFESFLVHEKAIREQAPESETLANLGYLAGLFRAARAEPDAQNYLQTFIRENPEHPNRVEAQLALAEIHLNQAPARPKAARQIFESLRTEPLTLIQNERLDYTSVWLELIDSKPAAFEQRAETFLKEWPRSGYFPEVSMLLARRFFEDNRREEANSLFRRITAEFPDSDFARLAPFFAAKSGPPGEETLLAWREIAFGDGPYALHARHELGLLFLEMDRFEEARETFAGILAATEPGEPIHCAAHADTGYAYYLEALASGKEETLLLKAAETFSHLSREAEAPASWRYAAALRRARCLEAVGNQEVALEIYRSIVANSADSAAGLAPVEAPQTQDWVYRAGFFAIRILQENEDWRAAIRMADELSRKSGPRAIEAANLAERMRLQNWIWD